MITVTISTFFFLIAPSLSLCPPPGAILPPPTLASYASDFRLPDAAFQNLTFLNSTSFAVQASIGITTVFQYEHSAPGREVNQSLFDTQFRLASATKLITALALELSKDTISLDDPITRFVPGLEKELYGDVTVKALADHTSGLGRFGYVGDLAYSESAASLGLPNITNTLPGCDPFPGGRICTDAQVLAMFNNRAYAPHSPHSRAMYSNIGYMLLGKALETVYNTSYEDVIQTLILDPVGMSKSTFAVPDTNGTAMLPRRPEDAGWFVSEFANLNPTGGLWSTPNEMLRFLHALQNGALLRKPALRAWMQPTTFSRSPLQYVGVGWEVFRIADLPLDFPRAVDVYTKSGGVPGYGSYVALIPEFDIAVTVNAAGGEISYSPIELLGTVVTALVPYADALAREQAAVKYAGTYKSSAPTSNDTMTISASSGPGLSIDALMVNGVPVLQALAGSEKIPFENFSARVYPTDPDSLGTEAESWRMLLDQKVPEQKLWGGLECRSWNRGDTARYVGEPLDTFVFHVEGDEVVSVELLGWRATLVKVN
ncbi:beta-lactamase/transpeptidase-like protein [Stemphylium lycopersici]|nr:beta-lactamase transpeptidase-like protein [Stemphylium lycopersici]RAR03494.1 beta-lactamase/transpeptidase-like protein [Stemphylium lycopersici]